MHLLLAVLILSPLATGAVILWTGHRLAPTFIHRGALALIGIAALCTLALLPYAGQEPNIEIEWLPGMGAMGIELGASGLYAALVTVWAAFVTLLGTASAGMCHRHPAHAVLLLALAASVVAFVSGHFLLRYAALEVVALCVALMPLIELPGNKRTRASWLVYVILRIGDVGLLIAVLILMTATGTLAVAPALQAGEMMEDRYVRWVAAGFVLAVWVKIGGWPFHLWVQTGQKLSLGTRSWLYATVIPNLGLYLLYRTTPLLARAGPIQHAALWCGAAGAALTAFLAVTQADLDGSLTYVSAALGGLALLAGGSGLKTVVWLSILVITPIRLLLYLAAGLPARSQMRTALLALGGIALTGWGLGITYWTRLAGAPLDVLFAAEAGAALVGVWSAAMVRRSVTACRNGLQLAEKQRHWTRQAVPAMLGAAVLVATLMSESLFSHLIRASQGQLPAGSTNPALDLLRYLVSSPAMWIVGILSTVPGFLRWRPLSGDPHREQVYDLEEGLGRVAQTLHAVVETGVYEQIIALIVRSVVGGARLTHRIVEHRLLEGTLRHMARVATSGGRLTYQIVEEEGLEGLLRRIVQVVLTCARVAQGWHTGKLRRNLLWVVISLALVMTLVLACW